MSETLIQSDPSIMMGKPVVAGTRITVELILENSLLGKRSTKYWMRTRGSREKAC